MRKKKRRTSGTKLPKQENEITMFGGAVKTCEIGMSPEISSMRKGQFGDPEPGGKPSSHPALSIRGRIVRIGQQGAEKMPLKGCTKHHKKESPVFDRQIVPAHPRRVQKCRLVERVKFHP